MKTGTRKESDLRNVRFRQFTVAPSQARSVLSTEKPVPMFDWERGEFIPEILLSDGMEVHGGRAQVPLLDSHARYTVDDVLGSAREIEIDGERIEAELLWSEKQRAKDARADVEAGHITDLSIGYRINKDATVFIGKDETATINGRTFEGPANVRTKWTLQEVSLVTIGANDEAKARGFKSIEEAQRKISQTLTEGQENGNGGREPEDSRKGAGAPGGGSNSSKSAGGGNSNQNQRLQIRTMDPEENNGGVATLTPEQAQAQRAADRKAAREEELQRCKEIRGLAKELGEHHSRGEHFAEWGERMISEDKPLTEVRAAHQAMMEWESKPISTGAGNPEDYREIPELGDKDVKRYSLLRAINLLANGKELDGLERELSDEIANRTNKTPEGFFAPLGSLENQVDGQRDVDSVTATGAAELVGVQHRPGDMIEALRNKQVIVQAGARSISVASGTISIPRQDGAGTFGWVAESGSLGETDITTGEVTATGKEGGASMTYTKKLLAQGTPSIEQLVRDDLTTIIAIGKDKAFIDGASGGNDPTGIKNTTGIGGVTFGVVTAPTWAEMIEFQTDVATGNAEMGSLAYLFNAAVRGNLLTTEKATNTARFIIDDNDMIGGKRYLMTEQVVSNLVCYGNFNDLIICDWGGVDIVVNPYSDDLARRVRVSAFITTDLIVRHAASFSFSSNAAA